MTQVHIDLPHGEIEAFCRRWNVKELSLFGSVLREDFAPESDVDVLVDFTDDSAWTLRDLIHMEDELARIMGRKVDLVDRRSVEASPNYTRRRHILGSLEKLYVA